MNMNALHHKNSYPLKIEEGRAKVFDEAAIRADQREIDAKIADGFVERVDREARPLSHKIMLEKHSWTIASAIRNGGKQP